jgi:hypothetical protein
MTLDEEGLIRRAYRVWLPAPMRHSSTQPSIAFEQRSFTHHLGVHISQPV